MPVGVDDDILYHLTEFPYRTGDSINGALQKLLGEALGASTPDVIADRLRTAVKMLRWYEIDNLSPHRLYQVWRGNRSWSPQQGGTGSSWVEGTPNPAVLMTTLASASKFAADWNNLPDKTGAMRSLQHELRPESEVWTASAVSRLTGLPKTLRVLTWDGCVVWTMLGFMGLFGLTGFLPELLGGTFRLFWDNWHSKYNLLWLSPLPYLVWCLVAYLRGSLKRVRWRVGRLRRWREWLISQGMAP